MVSVAQLDDTVTEPAPAAPARRWTELLHNPSLVAVGVWLVTAPVAFALPGYAGMDPFGQRAMGLTIGAGLTGIVAVLVLWWRWPSRTVAGVAAGLLASWAVLAQRTALNGTPFGMGGILDDAGRLAATVDRYTQTWATADMWVAGLPAQYPPLYFLLTGHLAAAIGQPAYEVHAAASVVVLSATVLLAFAFWRRLAPTWAALAVAGTTLLAFSDGRKAHEGFTLAIVVPWVLLTFARPPRRRLHWLAAGAIGALIVTTYQAWLVFLAIGVVTLAVLTWRDSDDRRGYLTYLGAVVGTAAVLSSWYLGPYLYALLTRGGSEVSDLYTPPELQQKLLPFLDASPLGVLLLIGLVGTLWLRTTAWWATPLLVLFVGTMLYRVLATIRLVATGHTNLLNYTPVLVVTILAAAGVLTLAHAGPLVVERFRLAPARGMATAALAVLMAYTTYTVGGIWMPVAEPAGHYVAQAHREPLPEGGYPQYAPANDRADWFPVLDVQRAVESVYGPNPHRVSVSSDDRLYVYLPWPGYTTATRGGAGALIHWYERRDEIQRLAGTTDPTEFARASADTRFGPIDIFVLKATGSGWTIGTATFVPAQFDRSTWAVFDNLPEGTVVAVRRP